MADEPADPKDLQRQSKSKSDVPGKTSDDWFRIVRDRPGILQATFTRIEVSTEVANMHVQIAKQTHAVPARQYTYRTGIVVAGLLLICGMGVKFIPVHPVLSGFLATALIVLGGAWGVVQFAERLKPKPPEQ